MDYLKLTLDRADDGTAGLTATVHADGFAGEGSAWFEMEELRTFCERLAEYPLGGRLALAGYPAQTQLSIQIDPHGHRGGVLVSVELADPIEPGGHAHDRHRRVRTSLIVGYNDLARFQAALGKLLRGRNKRAILKSGPDFA
jgi:hypothetical protein